MTTRKLAAIASSSAPSFGPSFGRSLSRSFGPSFSALSLAASLAGALAACAPEAELAAGEDDAPPVATPELSYLGPVVLSDAPYDDELHLRRANGQAPAAARATAPDARLARFDGDADRFGVVYVDLAKRTEHLAAYKSEEVQEVAAELARRGFHEGSGDGQLAQPRGISNTVDNRTSFQNYSLTHSLLRMVGQVGNGCSGALFGNRLVLTGAHCVFDGNGDYLFNTTFAPRRNGAELPYGSVASVGLLLPAAYKSDGCNTNYTGACVQNDWAVLILPENPWANSPNGSPGYFGVWWAGDATVSSFAVRNVGYPACGNAMSPASCMSRVAYGDLSCAGVAPRLSSPDSRWPLYGTNGKMDTGCDTSGGHSGGPIYSYSPGSNGPYLVGNTVWNQCNSSTCGPLTQYSSAGIRISESLANYMMNLRATYP